MQVVFIIAGFSCLLAAFMIEGRAWPVALITVASLAAACFLFALAAEVF